MNLLTLATGAIALTLWIPREAAMGAAYATVLREGVSTLCYTAWSVRALRRLAPAPHPPTQR
jgi:hypothetical protein